MTQHLLPEQTEEDQRTLRSLAFVVSAFVVCTAAMAIAIGVIMG